GRDRLSPGGDQRRARCAGAARRRRHRHAGHSPPCVGSDSQEPAMSAMAYHRPSSLAEAAKLAEGDPEARILAGGQSVLPSMKLGLLAPSAFIDLGALGELRGIRADRNSITIGAMTTHAAVAASA